MSYNDDEELMMGDLQEDDDMDLDDDIDVPLDDDILADDDDLSDEFADIDGSSY